MKKIILRRPWTTEEQRNRAYGLFVASEGYLRAAEYVDDMKEKVSLIQKAADCMNRASRSLGFRNLADMDKYKQIHGRI